MLADAGRVLQQFGGNVRIGPRPGRRAHLIVHDGQLFFPARELQQRQGEVRAPVAVSPARAQDQVVAAGRPEAIVREKRSYTGRFLKELLARRPQKRRAEAAE